MKTKVFSVSIVVVVLLAVLLLAVQDVAAAPEVQEASPFPEEVTVTVLLIWNHPGRYSTLITTGRRAYTITDASRAYWGAGPANRCFLLRYPRRNIYDAHCRP